MLRSSLERKYVINPCVERSETLGSQPPCGRSSKSFYWNFLRILRDEGIPFDDQYLL